MPDSGDLYLNRKKIQFSTALDSRMAGIETVYQNLALSPTLSIADNLYHCREINLRSYDMPHIFEVSDRNPITRHRKWLCVINPAEYIMSDAVTLITEPKSLTDQAP